MRRGEATTNASDGDARLFRSAPPVPSAACCSIAAA
jgi:hypothetical protein